MERIARAWSANHKRSVCLVDWHRLAAFNYAIVSLKYTQIVGEYMAKLIESLRPSTHLADISIVGHSLGAHVAGYCGQALNGSIGFIYGSFSSVVVKTIKFDSFFVHSLSVLVIIVIYSACIKDLMLPGHYLHIHC